MWKLAWTVPCAVTCVAQPDSSDRKQLALDFIRLFPISSDFPVKGAHPVSWAIIGLCGGIALIQLFAAGTYPLDLQAMHFGTHPALVIFDLLPFGPDSMTIAWRLITSLFVHAGPMHVLGNMLFFYCFSLPVESLMGSLRYAIFYLLCGSVGAIVYSMANAPSLVSLVGASGAVTGVLVAHTLLLPWARIRIGGSKEKPSTVPAWGFTGVWIGLQLVQAMDANSDIAFAAHFGGGLAGLLLAPLFVKPGVQFMAPPQADPASADLHESGFAVPRFVAASVALIFVAVLVFELVQWPGQADEKTILRARENIAIARIDGTGVPRDIARGLALYREVAALDASAASRLADLLNEGKKLPKDDVEAVKWYKRAADAQDPYGISAYALELIDGRGVARDTGQGVVLLSGLVDRGWSGAGLLLGSAYENGRGDIAVDLSRAADSYRRSCETDPADRDKSLGRAEACRRWAEMLADGRGVERDPDRAKKIRDQLMIDRMFDAAANQFGNQRRR